MLQEFVDTGVAHSQTGVDMAFDKLRGLLSSILSCNPMIIHADPS